MKIQYSIIILFLLFALVVGIYKHLNHVQGYTSREVCESSTNKPCMIVMCSDVLPPTKLQQEKYRTCCSQLPSGWVPQDTKTPQCTW